ncbi:G2/M phase-specific E3 ubiquitin-protein ligase-like [Anopheles nili]|uniref:G2/M phase-specific E3 ubiquitin-protein ligase-like n=1 Tax=Anopheles nili TaxID=185578 RepID=UPI00237C094C|nr:G2/M phase-specific E3 ubiquitin-protein ligase-like [Anopheles nili]
MPKQCFLCKSTEDDELLLGKFYTKWRLSVHYYCLLLSSNLVQNGMNDTVGIFGFLETDIRKENERTKKCRCYICKNMHANVSCCAKKCLRTFHTVCGIKNRCLSYYTGTFQSWCSTHLPLQSDRTWHAPGEPCSICYDDMGQYDKIKSVRAPCCRNGWFHQRCLAQYAQSAGYFFKCPLCNNEDKFLAEIPLRGVFVPERDAAWELEPNAFQEQLVRPTACDAEECKCAEGRSFDDRHWKLKICGSCGSTCRHQGCMESSHVRTYLCRLCRPIVGDRVIEDDDSDDSGDDAASSSSTSSKSTVAKMDQNIKNPTPGSESGVHCSSSDETLANIRRLSRRRLLVISDGSDSEWSDTSSIQIRRCSKRNNGKRVQRVFFDDSDSPTCSSVGSATQSIRSPTEDNSNNAPILPQSCILSDKRSDEALNENSNTPGNQQLGVERSSEVYWDEESSESNTLTSKVDTNSTRRMNQATNRRTNQSNTNASDDSTKRSDGSDESLPWVNAARKRIRSKKLPKIIVSSESDNNSDYLPLSKRRRISKSFSDDRSRSPNARSVSTIVTRGHSMRSSENPEKSALISTTTANDSKDVKPGNSTPPTLVSEQSPPLTTEKGKTNGMGVKLRHSISPYRQQSIRKFITLTPSKGVDENIESNTSTEDTVQRKKSDVFTDESNSNSSSNNMSSNKHFERRGTTKSAINVRRRQVISPKGTGTNSNDDPTQSSSKTQVHRSQNRVTDKGKGQKNIMSYFSRY